MENQKCEGDHREHICSMACEGKFLEIERIARRPGHICLTCGRVADKKENLCSPKPLGE